MRYPKGALVGLVGGVLLSAAVLTIEMVHAHTVMASQMANCEAQSDATAGGGICSASAQFGGTELLVTFVLGFAAAFIWFRRRQQRMVA